MPATARHRATARRLGHQRVLGMTGTVGTPDLKIVDPSTAAKTRAARTYSTVVTLQGKRIPAKTPTLRPTRRAAHGVHSGAPGRLIDHGLMHDRCHPARKKRGGGRD